MVPLQLRIAISKIDRLGSFVDYNYDTFQFEGFFKSIVQLADSFLDDPGINKSIILTEVRFFKIRILIPFLNIFTLQEGFGSYDDSTGEYSGVFGIIQRNVSTDIDTF